MLDLSNPGATQVAVIFKFDRTGEEFKIKYETQVCGYEEVTSRFTEIIPL